MLRIAIIAVALSFVSQAAFAQGSAPDFGTFQSNYPNSAFGIKAPAYRGTILLFDASADPGNLATGGFGTSRLLFSHLDTHAPPGVYAVQAERMDDYVDFAGGSDGSLRTLSPEERARLVLYAGATVQLDTALRADGADWVLKCRLTSPAGQKETEFRAPAGQDLALAQQGALWGLQGMGVEFTEAELAPFRKTLFGGLANSTSDALVGRALKGDIEGAKEALAKAPGDLALRALLAELGSGSGKAKEVLPLVVKAPLDLRAPVPARELLLRARLYQAAGAGGMAAQECMIALATNPGSDAVLEAASAILSPAALNDDATNEINSWRLRLPGRGMDHARGSGFLRNAALHFMPKGGLAAADPEALDAMAYYAQSSLNMASAGIKKVGPAPAIANVAMLDLAILGKREEIDPLFEAALKDFGASGALWRARLRLELPSMKGDAAKGVALEERAIAAAATLPDLGIVPFEHFVERAATGAPGSDPVESAKALKSSDADGWARARKGLELYMKGPGPGLRLARVGIALGALGEWGALDSHAGALSAEERAIAAKELRRMGHENTAGRIEKLDTAK